MSFFIKMSCIFAIGSTIGWVTEVIFRRFFSKNNPEKLWINPGFLKGPWLPLYGVGLCILYVIALTERVFSVRSWFLKGILLFLMALSMTAAEYLTGVFCLKVLKKRLWDYSNEKYNLGGLICLRFSLYWALTGAIYYFFVHHFVDDLLNFAIYGTSISFFTGIYLGVFSVDVAHSCVRQAEMNESKIFDELSSRS
jgi:uncharacterized membrane protein